MQNYTTYTTPPGTFWKGIMHMVQSITKIGCPKYHLGKLYYIFLFNMLYGLFYVTIEYVVVVFVGLNILHPKVCCGLFE